MTDSREQVIERLIEFGHYRAEAEPMLVDDDLWIVEPESRYVYEGEEAVREWSKAVVFANCLVEGFAAGDVEPYGALDFQGPIQQMLIDMRDRAQEALRRAKERAKA